MQNMPTTSPSITVNQDNLLVFSRSNSSTPTLTPVDLRLNDNERFSLYDSIPAVPDLLVNTYSWCLPVLRSYHHNHDNQSGRPFGSRNMAYC